MATTVDNRLDLTYSECPCVEIFFMRQIACIVFLVSEMYDMSRLSQIVLDEADTLLDDSFSQMTIRIIQKLKVELNFAQIFKSSS